jgi:hypothetical protein
LLSTAQRIRRGFFRQNAKKSQEIEAAGTKRAVLAAFPIFHFALRWTA